MLKLFVGTHYNCWRRHISTDNSNNCTSLLSLSFHHCWRSILFPAFSLPWMTFFQIFQTFFRWRIFSFFKLCIDYCDSKWRSILVRNECFPTLFIFVSWDIFVNERKIVRCEKIDKNSLAPHQFVRLINAPVWWFSFSLFNIEVKMIFRHRKKSSQN